MQGLSTLASDVNRAGRLRFAQPEKGEAAETRKGRATARLRPSCLQEIADELNKRLEPCQPARQRLDDWNGAINRTLAICHFPSRFT
jgi:hypothetical protein